MSERNPLLEWKNLALIMAAAATVAGGAYYFFSKQEIPPQLREMGIPMYPGAEVADHTTVRNRLSQAGKPATMDAVVLLTEDHPLRVVAFYEEALQGDVKVLEVSRLGAPSALLAVGQGDNQRWITINIDSDSGKTMLLITRLYGK